ncbi:MAG: ABC transporter ATP-binding protein [Variibacter sp.]
MSAPLLRAQNLVKEFRTGGRWSGSAGVVHALSDVSFDIEPGETLAVVGESGCGKSTLARCVTALNAQTSGTLLIDGQDARDLLRREPLRFRRMIQIVFQDPYASLNPRRTIQQSIGDALRLHRMCASWEQRAAVTALLERVGLSSDYLRRYPHELSGGQRQRVAIARALAVRPRLMVCDEPVSALDVSIQAQIINLLKEIQKALGVAYLFISHNLALVRHISDRIAVMYLGQIVEIGPAGAMRRNLLHPYSRALFAATPEIGRDKTAAAPMLRGDVPSPINPPSGCRFHTRCPIARHRCAQEAPLPRELDGRQVRCHFAEEMLPAA